MKTPIVIILIVFGISCTRDSQPANPADDPSSGWRKNFPNRTAAVNTLPKKENLWIFLMAGQSNMAGRGFVCAMKFF